MNNSTTWKPGDVALAHNLIGFPSSTLRVRIEKVLSEKDILVRTASLQDAGTQLNLDASQLEAIPEPVVYRHTAGLVSLI